jgi:hypothetical protein
MRQLQMSHVTSSDIEGSQLSKLKQQLCYHYALLQGARLHRCYFYKLDTTIGVDRKITRFLCARTRKKTSKMAANVRFAFAPALAIPGLLDYSKSEHVKIFRGAIKPVSETPFDCKADGLHQFLRDVHDRSD